MTLRKHYVLVCLNRRPDGSPKGSCAARGSERLYQRLKALVEERGLHQVEVRVLSTSCLDACRHGPAVLVEPDHFFYAGVNEQDAPEIVEALAQGSRVERLILEKSSDCGCSSPAV